ncbi:beta/gamma crystallin domain-containing protein [Streptomyces sp. NPDC001212]|uniref:beta/gamma crystallin domain-containing protein n=1 Tax=Streptomyces sp. HYC2 TaxID=2955207 RepID=UPI002480B465|nr:beta/gamma crystallin domain-containing protein [Streptomyces sp. HYC2]
MKKKLMSTLAAAGAAAAAFTVLGPATAASAADSVKCYTGTDYLRVWAHGSSLGGRSGEYCWANAGAIRYNAWIDRIQTGNNNVWINDANGSWVFFPKWTDTSFPNRPPNAFYIVIE